MSTQLICKHCQKPFTATNRHASITKYCQRQECRRDRHNQMVKAKRIADGTVNRHCQYCGRTTTVPRGTPKGTAVCPICLEAGLTGAKLSTKQKCTRCHKRTIHPGFRNLCWLCYVTDGDYDADSQLYGEGYLG